MHAEKLSQNNPSRSKERDYRWKWHEAGKNSQGVSNSGAATIACDIRVTFRHQVFFTQNAFSASNSLIRRLLGLGSLAAPRKVIVIAEQIIAQAQPFWVDEILTYFAAHSDVLNLVLSPVLIEGGEQVKNSIRHVARLQSVFQRHNLDRHSYVVGIGGGALLDMVGLAAALAHRGLRHVRMPSTTLSQADSGVGIKNGINAFGKKNFIGTFAPPYAVINDVELLNSLSDRDKRAGYAEAVKVALIRDRDFFARLEREVQKLRNFECDQMEQVIHRCAELHVEHIANSGDPLELSSARPLDFGHWSAHKLEALSHYRIRHGEAVAIGIALDVLYCRYIGILEEESAERVLRLLEGLGFDLFAKELLQVNPTGKLAILDGLEEFRQHLGGQLCVSLIKGIGREYAVNEMSERAILQAIRKLERRYRLHSALCRD